MAKQSSSFLIVLFVWAPLLVLGDYTCDDLTVPLFDVGKTDQELVTLYSDVLKDTFGAEALSSLEGLQEVVERALTQPVSSSTGLSTFASDEEAEKAADEMLTKHFAGENAENLRGVVDGMYDLQRKYLVDNCDPSTGINKMFSMFPVHTKRYIDAKGSKAREVIKNFNAIKDEFNEKRNTILQKVNDMQCNCLNNNAFIDVANRLHVTLDKELVSGSYSFVDEARTDALADRLFVLSKIVAKKQLKNVAIFAVNFYQSASQKYLSQPEGNHLLRRFTLRFSKLIFAWLSETEQQKFVRGYLVQFAYKNFEAMGGKFLSLAKIMTEKCRNGCHFNFDDQSTLAENKLLAFEFMLAATLKEMTLEFDRAIVNPILLHFDTVFDLKPEEILPIQGLEPLLTLYTFFEGSSDDEVARVYTDLLDIVNRFILSSHPPATQPEFALAFDKYLDANYNDALVQYNYHHFKLLNLITMYDVHPVEYRVRFEPYPATMSDTFTHLRSKGAAYKAIDNIVKSGETTAKAVYELTTLKRTEGPEFHMKFYEDEYDKDHPRQHKNVHVKDIDEFVKDNANKHFPTDEEKLAKFVVPIVVKTVEEKTGPSKNKDSVERKGIIGKFNPMFIKSADSHKVTIYKIKESCSASIETVYEPNTPNKLEQHTTERYFLIDSQGEREISQLAFNEKQDACTKKGAPPEYQVINLDEGTTKVLTKIINNCEYSATLEQTPGAEQYSEHYVVYIEGKPTEVDFETYNKHSDDCDAKRQKIETEIIHPTKTGEEVLPIVDHPQDTKKTEEKPAEPVKYTVTVHTIEDCNERTQVVTHMGKPLLSQSKEMFVAVTANGSEKVTQEEYKKIQFDCEHPKIIQSTSRIIYEDCTQKVKVTPHVGALPAGVKALSYFKSEKDSLVELTLQEFEQEKRDCPLRFKGSKNTSGVPTDDKTKVNVISVLNGNLTPSELQRLESTPEVIEYIRTHPDIFETEPDTDTEFVFVQISRMESPCAKTLRK